MRVSIRKYEEPDLVPLVSLWLESWKSTGQPASKDGTVEVLQARLLNEIAGGWRVFVATTPSELIGLLALAPGVLAQLFIAPKWQGRGVGRQLLEFTKTQMADGVMLTTAVDNTAACRFYEREGLLRGPISQHPRHSHLIVQYEWQPC